MRQLFLVAVLGALCLAFPQAEAVKVVAFATNQNDLGHLSFVREARAWFPQETQKLGYEFEYTQDWSKLNDQFLASVDIVIFLDTRPENANQRAAFERYMRNGGAWIGFHFAAFALTPSAYPQNWNWYHNEFLGSGQYVSNTWKPTSAVLQVINKHHPSATNLPATFRCQPNEWYRWQHDLRKNSNIDIVLAIHDSSFPLGTNPPETWYSGYYPVVWSNKNYRNLYINMGHNDIDYANGNRDLSKTFENEVQNRIVINSLRWMGAGRRSAQE